MKPASSPPAAPNPDALRRLAAAAEEAAHPPPSTATSTTPSTTLTTPPSSSTTTTTTTLRPTKARKLTPSSSPAPLPRPLSSPGEVSAALRHLRSSDPSLTSLIDSHDPPSFHSLYPPFHSLARSILYQQLASKAASSIHSRFVSLCGGDHRVLPDVVLSLSPQQLRQIGVSDRKSSYLYDLAHKYATGILSDESVVSMDDRSLFTMLTMVKGIGAWSVHMFMIFSLHRPDVLPIGDLGVRKGVQMLYSLDALPRPSQMEQLCERWRPYRSIGAWYMWRLVETKGSPGAATGLLPNVRAETFSTPPAALHVESYHHHQQQQQHQHQIQLQQEQEEEQVVVHQQQMMQHQHQQQQVDQVVQQQLIAPVQGYPNLGGWGWRSL